jgi:hypothetical protein
VSAALDHIRKLREPARVAVERPATARAQLRPNGGHRLIVDLGWKTLDIARDEARALDILIDLNHEPVLLLALQGLIGPALRQVDLERLGDALELFEAECRAEESREINGYGARTQNYTKLLRDWS